MNLRAALSVSTLVALAIGGFVWFLSQSRTDSLGGRDASLYYANFADASGLRNKTRIQISGIDVGKVESIAHARNAQGKLIARIGLRIGRDYQLFADAEARKTAESLLGDYRIDLDPGSPTQPLLEPGSDIGHVGNQSDIDEIKSQLLRVTRNVAAITETLAHVIGGKDGEGSLTDIVHSLQHAMRAVDHTTQSLEHNIVGNRETLDGIIQDIGQLSHTLATIAAPGGDLLQTSKNVAAMTQKIDRIAESLQDLVSEGEDDPSDDGGPAGDPGQRGLKGSIAHLGQALRNVDDITRKVDEGQGTLGRVVNDPTIADRIEETLTSANQIIGSIAGLETVIELRSQYDTPFAGTNSQIQPSVKNTLALRIMPKPDKYYLFEAISDPRGKQVRNVTTTSFGGNTYTAEETKTSYNSLKFSAMFAKRYYFATLRFGILENTGGLGVNLHLFDDRGELRLDAFDFARRDPANLRTVFPRVRATALYQVIDHIHLQAGFDDPFNRELRTWFLGGVLRFTDEDLKGLLTVAPRP